MQREHSIANVFTTDSGYFGLGPNCTTVGDQVYLLIGSDVPFVLRPAGEEFLLVGACHVHGIMYGEGLHRDFSVDSCLYPGSVPGGEWNFSNDQVPPAEWVTVADCDDGSDVDGSTCHEMAPAISNAISEEKNLKGQKYLFYEDEREPVVIGTQRIILK